MILEQPLPVGGGCLVLNPRPLSRFAIGELWRGQPDFGPGLDYSEGRPPQQHFVVGDPFHGFQKLGHLLGGFMLINRRRKAVMV